MSKERLQFTQKLFVMCMSRPKATMKRLSNVFFIKFFIQKKVNKPMKAKVNLNGRKIDETRKRDIIKNLLKNKNFKYFKEFELRILCQYLEHHYVRVNEMVLTVGEPLNNFMIVYSGKIGLFNDDKKTMKILKKKNLYEFEDKDEVSHLQCVDKLIYEILFELDDSADYRDIMVQTLLPGDFVGSLTRHKKADKFHIAVERVE